MFNILLVEDEKNLRTVMKAFLIKNNYHVIEAEDGKKALEQLENNQVDLIISDIMMPNMDGYELAKELRASNYKVPILMVTARDTIDDKKEGFESGTDDYMVKPIDMEEMILRIGALLKRANVTYTQKLTINGVIIDYETLSVIKENKVYTLKQKEFYILFKLLSCPNKIFTRQDLMEEFWGIDSESDPRTVDVHITRIREKIADIKEFQIVTIRGLGYKGVINEK